MVSLVNLALMSDPTNVDWVRQELIDMPSAEQATARRAARAVDADRKPKVLGVQLLLEMHHAPRFEVSPKEGAHDRCMILDDAQGAILDPVAQRNDAAQ